MSRSEHNESACSQAADVSAETTGGPGRANRRHCRKMGRQPRRPLLAPRIQWTWVVCGRMPIANATIEGFAIFRANDFEAHRNGFHAEVVSASFRLRKGGQVPIVRIAGMSVTQSIECQQSSHVL